MHLSVVIPVRNEAENILPLLAEIHAALEGQGEFEVVYVDDGSGDATPDTDCGLKLILRSAVLELPVFDHMHRFLPALIQRNGGATLSMDVNHRPRTRGTSNYGMFDRLWVGSWISSR